MSNLAIPNAAVLSGVGTYPAHIAYRALVAAHGHDELCDAYGLDRDAVNGGTHYLDIVRQAVLHGDLDPDTLELN